MKKYDVIVIGSGGGAKITSPAAKLGLKVACIEKDALGGTCLNRGCIPSKMLIHPADLAAQLKDLEKFNIKADLNFTVNFKRLITRISNTVDADSSKIVEGYNRNSNIDFFNGLARFKSNKVLEVNGIKLTADKIFIAVGARPHIPDIQGLTESPYMTSTEALRNTKLPKKMVVIGASYIAVELGHAYGALGCEVHFLVRSKFLRQEDSQVAEEFTNAFSKQYPCHIGALPTNVIYKNKEFSVQYTQADKQTTIDCDALLIATGIIPNNDTLALENTDIKLNEKGLIVVDKYMQTAVDGVYAMGDCVGHYYFRHSVNFEGEYLFDSVIRNKDRKPINYPPVGHAIFSHPQVAGIGKTEDQLKADGIDYIVGLNYYKNSAMGMALLSDSGFCKILFDKNNRKILGAHIVGDEASNMIHMIIAFMTKKGTLDDLLGMIYIHPALPEIVRNAARKAKAQFDILEEEQQQKSAISGKLEW